MKLDLDAFARVVRDTPLVSIDLIVRDPEGRVLLGMRNNPPARDHWFVPGGRILKDERLDTAFSRITRDELGVETPRRTAKLLGVYDHLYPDNMCGEPGYGTHYVVLAYELSLALPPDALPGDQHNDSRWFFVDELMRNGDVHSNTKAYFRTT
jgi:colanic acid biosynthesis protein WcaH